MTDAVMLCALKNKHDYEAHIFCLLCIIKGQTISDEEIPSAVAGGK